MLKRRPRRATTFGVVAVAVVATLAACSPRDDAPGAGRSAPSGATTSIDSAPARSDNMPAAPADSLWFRRVRTLDLTNDGLADSVIVEARGTRSDSLRFRLRVIARGAAEFTQEWDSKYELMGADAAHQHPPASDAYVRDKVARTIDGIAVAPLDTLPMRDFGGDTVVLRMARRGPVPAFTVAYGYETSMKVVWDQASRRFRVAYSCC